MQTSWLMRWGWSLIFNRRPASAPLIGSGLPRPLREVSDERWMDRAFEVAAGTPAGDVPVGAVIVGPDGAELGWGTNRREADVDPLGHAEIAAMRAAVGGGAVAGVDGAGAGPDGWRLTGCTAYVTLEPCAMCAGALVEARIARIVYAAAEPKTGACGSVWDIPRESPLHEVQVRGGVQEARGQELLRNFFHGLRDA